MVSPRGNNFYDLFVLSLLINWALLRWTIPPYIYITVGKEPVSKDPMVEINCIPPRLNMWYRVACIDGIGILLVVFLGGINEIFDLFISKFFISL
jgi:hypothetical protein